jgi:hypothetical protein
MEVVVDVANQADPLRQQMHSADAASGKALDAIGEFVVDVVGGHHRLIAFRSGPVLDAMKDPLLTLTESSAVAFPGFLGVAFSGFLGDSRSHSKASKCWNSEDVLSPPLFQILRGFSTLLADLHHLSNP